jgi:hypothetical protein
LAWPLQSLAASDIYAASQATDDDVYSPLVARQGLRILKGGQRAAEIIEEIIAEAGAALLRLQDATDRGG